MFLISSTLFPSSVTMHSHLIPLSSSTYILPLSRYRSIIFSCSSANNSKSRYCFLSSLTSIILINRTTKFKVSVPYKFRFVKFISALSLKSNDTVYHFRNIQCRYFHFLRYTEQNIFLYTIISYTEFDLFSFSGAYRRRTRYQHKQVRPPFSIARGRRALFTHSRSWSTSDSARTSRYAALSTVSNSCSSLDSSARMTPRSTTDSTASTSTRRLNTRAQSSSFSQPYP